MKYLFLVEREGHAAEALARASDPLSPVRLLALAPEVEEVWNKAGVTFRVPEDYVTPEDMNAEGLAAYERLERCLGVIEEELQNLPNELRLNPVAFHFYHLKLLLDSLGLRAVELQRVLLDEKPDRVVCFVNPSDPFWAPSGGHCFLEEEGPVYSRMAPFVCGVLGIPYEEICSPLSPNSKRSFWEGVIRAGWRSAKSFFGRFHLIWRRKIKRPVLWQVGPLSHDMPVLRRELRPYFRWMIPRLPSRWNPQQGETATNLELNSHVSLMGEEWNRLQPILRGNPAFVFRGMNIFPMVEHIFRTLFIEWVPKASVRIRVARDLIRQSAPKVVLSVISPFTNDLLLLAGARAERVPVVFLQEGGLYGYCQSPMHHYNELCMGDYMLTYGGKVADYLNHTRLTQRQCATPMAVGAFRLRQLLSKEFPRTGGAIRNVMYVPTTDFHHSLRYAPLNFSKRDYVRKRRSVMETLLGMKEVHVFYKVPPSTGRTDGISTFLKENQDRVTIVSRPLTKVLGMADAFVLDWPTTTLLEILTTHRPLAVFLDQEVTRPLSEAMNLLRRRAFVATTFPQFLTAIRQMVSSSSGEVPDVNDQTFLEAYGTAGAGAWSSKRLVQFLMECAPSERTG